MVFLGGFDTRTVTLGLVKYVPLGFEPPTSYWVADRPIPWTIHNPRAEVEKIGHIAISDR